MLKRLFDMTCAATALVMLSPIYTVVAYKVKKNLGSPVLFRQTRPGRYGKPFEMIKFRSMKDAVDKNGELLIDELRLTSFGKALRSSSLDELPELWNVLKGDMSLVGPRPLLIEYLPLYSAEQYRRHQLRPGITGWAQINGRNGISWQDRFALDIWYVDHRSLWLDLKILVKTINKVLVKEGVNDSHGQIMQKFTGGEGESL